MTLLITLFAAIVSTVVWYKNAPADEMKVGNLALMYWGASLMWMVDAIAEYIELRADFFVPSYADMANDAFLGISVVAFGLIIWLIGLLVKDPKGVVKASLLKK